MRSTNTHLLNLVKQILDAKDELAKGQPGQFTQLHNEVNRLEWLARDEIQRKSNVALGFSIPMRDVDEQLNNVLDFFTIHS